MPPLRSTRGKTVQGTQLDGAVIGSTAT
ncbi:adhesin, partial [Yersinia pestis]